MDKETLSNYGWIVICVLVLAVMIALATPFGNYVKEAIWSTTNGLFDVSGNAMDSIDDLINPKNKATFIAHQGYAAMYPRNTLLAVEGAKKYGYDYVEVDLCVTADNHFVLMHDTTVDSMTDGTGTISDMTLAEVQALNIDNFSDTYSQAIPGIKVPTLEEFLECCNENDIIPIIEIKNVSRGQVDAFVNILKTHNIIDKTIVESFDKNTMNYLRSICEEITLAPLVSFTKEDIDICKNLGGSIVNVNYTDVTQELVDYAHEQGLQIMVWTVNKIEDALMLEKLGVEYIMTEKILYNNNFANYEAIESRTIADKMDATPDQWGMIVYENKLLGEDNVDLIHFRAEVLYTEDAPTVYVGDTTGNVPLNGEPNEWQVIDIIALKGSSVNISMKNKTGLVSVKNATIEVLSLKS